MEIKLSEKTQKKLEAIQNEIRSKHPGAIGEHYARIYKDEYEEGYRQGFIETLQDILADNKISKEAALDVLIKNGVLEQEAKRWLAENIK